MKFLIEKALADKIIFPEEVWLTVNFSQNVIGKCKITREPDGLYAETNLPLPHGYPAIGYSEPNRLFCVSINSTSNQDDTIQAI